MDKLGKFRDCLDQMTRDQFPNPLGRFLPHLGLQLDLQHSVREFFNIPSGELIEREVDPDVGSSPVLSRTLSTIPVVFSDEGELSVEGDSDSCVTGKLESRSVVEGSHDCTKEGSAK